MNRWTNTCDLNRELKKQCKLKVTVIPVVVSALGTIPKGVEKKMGGTWNQMKNCKHLDHSIAENIQKSPRDSRRLVVNMALVKDHRLKLMWKTCKEQQQQPQQQQQHYYYHYY